ncbi:MAG: thioredoxin family protein [bacterium]|nr:thioredoxin family protein [bacterium]
MNKNIVLGGVVIIAIVAFIVLSSSNKEKQVINTQNNLSNTEEVKKVDTVNLNSNTNSVNAIAGSYESYAPEKLAFAETGNVVLFFHASWCPSCRALDKNLNENLSNIPTDLKILKVDYDNSKELKQKYGVTTQHTLVQVDKDGNMISKWSGSPTLSSLVTQVK